MKLHRILFLAATLCAAQTLGSQTVSQAFKGWPGHDDISDLKAAFANPPKGYGNVPFYWWSGDALVPERLQQQLDILADASTDGLCVSYNHTHDKVDTLVNAAGHGPCGRVSGGSPRVMSPEWWEIWNGFSASCAEKGIGLGMDDYVIAWPKNGEFIDSILARESYRNYPGQLVLKDGKISVEPSPWLHPDFGKDIVEMYFQTFADKMDSAGVKGMNYFFQDELQYGLNLRSWCEDMPEQFDRRKGYDIVTRLKYLFIENPDELTPEAVKVRLDYAEVLTDLAEERYFKPIFDWHASRGLIYGCDPESRGKNPVKYLDYFRAMSWFTAPGNDAPARGSSFLQTKVSSSISHMYGRPRTWLEAFHSMNWDANGATLTRQLDHHMIAGGNLLCMHGLYYSTHGGWWEWAPPCFHFRMPYWPHMKHWLRYAERSCFLLSQGSHVCDIAILYPTETLQAVPGTNAKVTFAVADSLSRHCLDYDFIDYASLQKAEVNGQSLCVAGESYKVLVLADCRAMHEETASAIREFEAAGGIVLRVGDAESIVADIRDRIIPDFNTQNGSGRVLHRRIGERDVYMTMDVRQGDSVFFRNHGKTECWNAMDGTVEDLPVLKTDTCGTWIRYPKEDGAAMLVVFSPGEPVCENGIPSAKDSLVQEITGDWDVEFVPTLDNRWGDFRLPASDGMIGVEARRMNGSIYGYGPYMEVCSFAPGDTARVWKPYEWSWQYGVPDAPGNQGWHGLKSKVDSKFIILDKEGTMQFRTNVLSPEDGDYVLKVEGVVPDSISVDSATVCSGPVHLTAGWHTLLLTYENTHEVGYALEKMRGGGLDKRPRSMVVFYPEGSPEPQENDMYAPIVASKWYGTDHLVYDTVTCPDVQCYSFRTAPGTRTMEFDVCGKVRRVIVGGVRAGVRSRGGHVTVRVRRPGSGVQDVEVYGRPQPGCPGAAFFSSPVKMTCRGAKMPSGDWTAYGALENYSGAVRYSRDVEIDRVGGKIILDLGEVDATCEVAVNGSPAGVLVGAPYKIDITPLAVKGKNHLEVLVYSSLSNHYGTIPSAYRGIPHAGLIGPARLVSIEDRDYSAYVNPFVGTDGHGHTFPAATCPFGMVQAGPDTRLNGWDGCSGYHYSDSVILGFTHTHLSGTGCLDYGDVLLMPVVDTVVASEFSHSNESASPGYYQVYLERPKVNVRIAAGRRMAMHEYVFSGRRRGVVIDLHHRDRLLGSFVSQVGASSIEGWRQSRSWARSQDVYFHADFSEPIEKAEFVDSAYLGLWFAPGRDPVKVKIGISSVSCAGAKNNLLSEKAADDWDFEALKESARQKWNQWLSRIDITAPERQKRIFYTCLYHTAIHPSLYSDANGEYRGMDRKVHKAEGFDRYTVFSIWDVFRACFPLYNLIARDYMPDFLESMLTVYNENGRLPKWELAGNETNTMIGYNSVSVIADAYAKGTLPQERLEEFYEAMKGTAEHRNESHDYFCKWGFDPAGEDNESVSKTLEYAYDDWCIATMAAVLGKDEDYTRYIRQAQYWKNLFDSESGFMRPRELGGWAPEFNPEKVTSHYTEANSWQYSFFVPQDIAGHIAMFGGAEAYNAKLDSLFAASHDGMNQQLVDVDGFVGQYAHGNEPSHHVAYLYDFSGQPWKTQHLTRHICDTFYGDGPDGVCGNEDCGQMSAWYILSSMGLYSLTPGTPVMALTSPLFEKSVINLPDRTFTVSADKPEYEYIASACLDGKAIDAAAIDFADIIDGGTLSFVMDSVASSFGKNPVMVTSIPEKDRYDAYFPENFGIRENIALEATMKVTARTEYQKSYSAGGDTGLVDGIHGKLNWRAGGWQGYKGKDVDLIVDLLGSREISCVGAEFLQDMNNYIWFPSSMEVYVSRDGENYELAGTRATDVAIDDEKVQIAWWKVSFAPQTVSHVRIVAHLFGEIPSWHRGYGDVGFTFIDEISVE